MSIGLTREQLAEVVGGRALGDSAEKISFRGVEFDSREITGGELFLALAGEANHGHEFLAQAFQRGAALALVENEAVAANVPEPERLILVPDTLRAFWTLAGWWRTELGIPVVGVTGSVGKTTVKEMLASILLRRSRGTYSRKSFNNHVGLPYTICCIARDHEWAVLEMGMNHSGELRNLTNIARPDIGAVVNVRPVHIEYFETLERIADAKLEILEGMAEGAPVILRAADVELERGIERHDPARKHPRRTFGDAPPADCYFENFQSLGFDGIQFELVLDGERTPVRMGVLGRHNALNACAAALIARSVYPDYSLEAIGSALEAFAAPLMRLDIKTLADGRRIVDDCYNASPTSMRAALELMRELCGTEKRFGLVLGDMLELGDAGRAEHEAIGRLAAEVRPVFVIAVGEFSAELTRPAQEAGIPAFQVQSPVAAAHTARKMKFDAVLVKASRGVRLEKAVEAILEHEQ